MKKQSKSRYTAKKQKRFLEVYKKTGAYIFVACDAIGVTRKTYYEWRKTCPVFDEKCDEIEDSLVGFAESHLMQNIKAGKEASIFFFLCNRAPDRWRHIQTIEHGGDTDKPFRIILENVDTKKFPTQK